MVIVIQCPDQVGLVAKISGLLAEENFNIVSMHEHVDKGEDMFFMRLEVDCQTDGILLEKQLYSLLPELSIVKVNPNPEKKVIVMVTKEYHCLADILVRHHFKTLGAAPCCVIGNHKVLQDICDRFDIQLIKLSELDWRCPFLKSDSSCFSAVTVPCGLNTAIVHNDSHHRITRTGSAAIFVTSSPIAFLGTSVPRR